MGDTREWCDSPNSASQVRQMRIFFKLLTRIEKTSLFRNTLTSMGGYPLESPPSIGSRYIAVGPDLDETECLIGGSLMPFPVSSEEVVEGLEQVLRDGNSLA